MTGDAASEALRRLDPVFALAPDEGTSKVVALGDALRTWVTPGSVVHVAYNDARPNAALMELTRTFAGIDAGLTITTAGLVNVQHALLELGIVRKLVASFAGENYPVARPNPALQRAVAAGRVTIESWSLWGLIARLAAASLGVTHFPIRSMVGSTMGDEAVDRGDLITVASDLGDLTLARALTPDVVLLHGAVADAHGNVVLSAPYGEGIWGSLAARVGVVATVERIVSTDEIRSMNRLARVPGHVVRAVCEVPFGAHPYGFNSPVPDLVPSYVEDDPFMAECLRAAKSSESFRRWIDEWILDVTSHEGYITMLGEERLASLRRAESATTSWRAAVRETWLSDEPPTPTETQVVVASRRMRTAVVSRGHHVVLAGVGLSNLAAWVGADLLRSTGVDVELMAEIGLYGYAPRPGEPFIFAGQNVPTNKLLTDVMSVLGTFVAGPASMSLGMIGAGEIDATGAVNSTYSAAGDYLVGSGGANDVLSAADEVIVTVAHQPGRLVERVPYVTSPGARVRTIVTDLCVLERGDDDQFELVALLPAAGAEEQSAIDLVRSRTGFEFRVRSPLVWERLPEPDELLRLRAFDPGRQFLRDRPGAAPE